MTEPIPVSLTLLTAPAATVISLDEAWAQLRLDPVENSPEERPDDALIEACIRAATDELDGANGWLGRALVTQTWRLTCASFPCGGSKFYLPLPPLRGVTQVSYLDAAGERIVLTDADASPPGEDYRVISDASPGYILPPYGKSWPRARRDPDSVRIDFVAGFGDPADVPELIRQWIKARVGFYYENREMVQSGITPFRVPGYAGVLENWRVRGAIVT